LSLLRLRRKFVGIPQRSSSAAWPTSADRWSRPYTTWAAVA